MKKRTWSNEKKTTVKAGVFFFDGYHMRDSNGVYTGYGIDLLNLISQYSHLNFVYTGYDKSWEEMLDMLERGEIDVVTSARKTKQRAETFATQQYSIIHSGTKHTDPFRRLQHIQRHDSRIAGRKQPEPEPA